ncbi:TPA_asm: hypothetical protein HUJ06_031940 [Nelumbo nucifera]|uniref:DNA-directed RNA polymerase n=1 Tax=Nelumbo nucifera TaxID=4432 RepID=A0A822ZW86_NELNU|nr:TPA_asm: hypothetical protein HUJ06_031940 [Nelumbo nucifera]
MEVLMAERADLVFHNKVIDGTAMKRLISRLIDHFGMAYTSHILDQVKTLGFQQATATSISLGIDDLLTIPSKGWLVRDAEQQKKLRQSIEIWYATSEYLRQEMNPNFRMTDPSNPVHIMSFSGARGNASQVHQLVGMRGLMSDPQGQMIDLPIQSNLRKDSLNRIYHFLLWSPQRLLVEVVQQLVVRRTDCGTVRGISQTIYIWVHDASLFEIRYWDWTCQSIHNLRAQPISIRTPFTCRSTSWICRLCYGRSPTHGDLVELGEAVGIIAELSYRRSIHRRYCRTGTSPSNGKIKFNEDLVHPTRTRHGHPAFLCYIDLYVTIESQDIIHNVNIPPKSFLLVQNDQYVESEQRVRKHIYSDSEGEMHWSTDVYHATEYTYGNVHLLPKTSHLWILSGSPCRQYSAFSLHKDQDQMSVHSLSVEGRYISNLSVTNDQVRHKLFSSDPSSCKKGERILDFSGPDRIICNEIGSSFHSNLIKNGRKNYARAGLSIETIMVFRKIVFLLFEIPDTEKQAKEFRPKYQKKLDRFFFIPEEVHIYPVLPYWTNNRIKNKIEKLDLYPTDYTYQEKFLVRPVVTYEIADGINLATLFPQDLLQERDNVQLRVVNYILYGNGKPIRGISHTSIQLVRTCLVLNWDQDKKGSSIEEVHASLVEVRANDLIRDFIRMDLAKSPISYIGKRNDPAGSGLISDNRSDRTNRNPFYSKARIQQSLSQHQGTIRTLLNRNKECQSLIILSSSNCSRIGIGPFNGLKYHNVTKESIKRDPLISIRNSFGPLGTVPKIANFYSSYYHLITHNQILINKYLLLDNLKQTFQVLKYYLIDEMGIFIPIMHPIWPLQEHLHGHYGILYEGYISYFIYENRDLQILGILGDFDCAELTIAQSRISLVNKIQKVYRSQGVQIHNRHIEIIVRQITSKVVVSEDGMSNVFCLGLIGLLRAERTGRALEEAICYRAVLLGITRASLNTQSFISEASFQETARVLAKAALRGRIDWLKGRKNLFEGEMRVLSTTKLFHFCIQEFS